MSKHVMPDAGVIKPFIFTAKKACYTLMKLMSNINNNHRDPAGYNPFSLKTEFLCECLNGRESYSKRDVCPDK